MMMTQKNLFRLLVALSLAAGITGTLIAAFPGNISADWKTVLEWQSDGSVLLQIFEIEPKQNLRNVLLFVFGVGVLLFVFAVQIGMFLFWHFARPSYAVLSAIFILLSLFDGLQIMIPMEVLFYDLALLLDGAIIAMSYLSPISGYFEKRIN